MSGRVTIRRVVAAGGCRLLLSFGTSPVQGEGIGCRVEVSALYLLKLRNHAQEYRHLQVQNRPHCNIHFFRCTVLPSLLLS